MQRNVGFDRDNMIESGNWNISESYSKMTAIKIKEIQDLLTICFCGTSELTGEFLTDEKTKRLAKINSLYRVIVNTRILALSNRFGIRKKEDKPKMQKIMQRLSELQDLHPLAMNEKLIQNSNGDYKVMEIDEKYYNLILELFMDVYDNLLQVLNESDLIYYSTDEYDPDEMLKNTIHDFVSKG